VEAHGAALLLWSALLALTAARALAAGPEVPCGLCAPQHGPPVLVPELASDGAERLAWLPGLGAGRAARVVSERPWLGAPLTPESLARVPGVGAVAAREVRSALARWTERRAAQGQPGAAQR
jgi:hypothetical protein